MAPTAVMKSVALVNGKGGAGKTTCAVNLAAYFARADLKTVLLDADAMTHMASWWLNPADDPGFDHAHLESPKKLTQKLSQLRSQGYEMVVIDTPPALHSKYTVNAIYAADLVIVPSRMTMLDLSLAIDTAREAKITQETRMLLTQVDPHSLSEAYAAKSALEATGLKLMSHPIRAYKAHERAAGLHQTIFDFNERGIEIAKPRSDVAKVGEEAMRLLGYRRRVPLVGALRKGA